MPTLGWQEIVLVGGLLLLLFGGRTFARLAREAGKGFGMYRKVKDDLTLDAASLLGPAPEDGASQKSGEAQTDNGGTPT